MRSQKYIVMKSFIERVDITVKCVDKTEKLGYKKRKLFTDRRFVLTSFPY